MARDRWDETWYRLREWTNGQAPSERLAVQLLLFSGYEDVDPSHPHGGPDGGQDILCKKDGLRCLAAVYFPREPQNFRETKRKFQSDFQKAEALQPPIGRFLFITNQELRRAQRGELRKLAENVAKDIDVHLYHLERITGILDFPGMQAVRHQFLGIGDDPNDESGGSGGRGGNAHAIGAYSTAVGGHGGLGGVGPGGDGGHGQATGDGSMSIGGNGGDGAQPGGMGGRGARGPTERFGFHSSMWGPGRGGRGGCTPEFIRLRGVLSNICQEYLKRFLDDEPFINAGLEQVPTDWLNQRLVELGEKWRVDGDDTFRVLRELDQ